MDYDELHEMIEESLTIQVDVGQYLVTGEEMTLTSFLDYLFWRGTAIAGRDLWERGPTIGDEVSRGHQYVQNWGPIVKFRHEGTTYYMKVVEAFNQNIKAGEKLWWMTKEYTDPSVPAPPKEWQYATVIEMTREGDPDVLRIYQTYGEPHGVWEWDIEKLGNPISINYLRFK